MHKYLVDLEVIVYMLNPACCNQAMQLAKAFDKTFVNDC